VDGGRSVRDAVGWQLDSVDLIATCRKEDRPASEVYCCSCRSIVAVAAAAAAAAKEEEEHVQNECICTTIRVSVYASPRY
jgi:hypothetical protein